jgi:hypothetical protein
MLLAKNHKNPGRAENDYCLHINNMPNRNLKAKRRPRRKTGKTYDIAGSKSATRGNGSALKDARDHLPLLGNQYEDRKMLYYEYQITLTGASGILDTHYFSANGIFDPDITGTGHQPIGFDQAMLFFEQYVVFRSTITVTFKNNAAGTGVRCGVFLNPDTSNPTISGVMENGYMKSAVVNGTESANSGPGFHNMKTVSLSCDSVAYFDSKSRKLHAMRDTFSGTSAANPSEQVYFGIFAFNMVSATTYELFFDVMISYDVRFWEPRKVAASLLHKALTLVLKPEEEEKESLVLVAKEDAKKV